MVGERSVCDEAEGVTHSGACRSENAGTSNRNASENLAHRKIKVSVAMSINHGLVGPKAMAKAGVDGQMVNIPLPITFRRSDVVLYSLRIIGFALMSEGVNLVNPVNTTPSKVKTVVFGLLNKEEHTTKKSF